MTTQATAPPKLLLQHHLKALRLPVFGREYAKMASQCAADNRHAFHREVE